MATYSVDDLKNKSLYAKTGINARKLPDIKATMVKRFNAGELIGTLYSYVHDKAGAIWWQFYDQNNIAYYVKHMPDLISTSALKEQGVLTTSEKAEKAQKAEEEAKPIGTQLKDQLLSFTGTIKYIAIAAIVIFVLIEINKHYPLAKLIKR
jgi:hypothetical protein